MSNQPYIGLRPFERNETDIFFGRETHSDELINRLGSNHFLAVIGTSGCGKSSLVKTGLIAGLEAGYLAKAGTHWHIVEMRPGQQPFYALAEKLLLELKAVLPIEETAKTLADKLRQGSLSLHELLAQHPLPNHAQLLIVCDQFEEIFRYFQHGEAAEARNFVSLLLASSKPYPLTTGVVSNSLYVVITMRSDFLGDCAQFAGLAEAINQGLYLTPRLDAQQLRAAIEEPAFVFSGEVEPALVTQLLEDAGNNPDQLPLLQHALMIMWQLAEKDGTSLLTIKHYEQVGGLSNALSNHADRKFKNLSPPQQRIAEIMFRALTERADSQRDTRRPLPLAEIVALTGASFAEVVAVIDEFRQAGRCFLMPPINVVLNNDSVIDISHESFIRQWQMLKDWAADEADSAKMYQRLEDKVMQWQNGKGSLLHSPELEIYQQWWQEKNLNNLWLKRYGELQYQDLSVFIEKSIDFRETEIKKKKFYFDILPRIAESQDILTRSLMANDLIHRLNNAGGIIPMWADLISDELEREYPNLESINKYNKQICDSSRYFLEIVNNIRINDKESEIDVNLMLDNLLRHLRSLFYDEIKNKKIEITCDFEHNLYSIYGSFPNIANAINVIIENSINAILKKGCGKIHIDTKNIGHQYIGIKIEDTGIGILSKNLHNIFTPFFKEESNNFGYELWRAKMVIEKIGGNIHVEYEEEKGCTFLITIPKINGELKNV